MMIVGNEDTPSGLWKFCVSRVTLEQISTRFSEAVARNTKVSRLGFLKTKVIIFPDDDARAMAAVLYFAHYKFEKLPLDLSLDDTVNLARLSERYDLNGFLRINLERWFKPHRQRILEEGYERWLYVAWQFGLGYDYVKLADFLQRECPVDEQGRLLSPFTERLLDEGYFPPHSLGKPRSARMFDLLH